MKYIMTEEGPIIFPMHMKHSDMAKKIDIPVISAGFCDIVCYDAYGESLSLKLSHIAEDLEDIQFHASLK